MSWSIYGRDDHRRPRLSRICVDPLMMMILMGLLVGLVVPNVLHRPTRAAVGALAIIVAGLCCLALAKTSLWRQGIWMSWGSNRMTKGYAILYKWGWAGIGIGVLLLLLTWRLTVANFALQRTAGSRCSPSGR